LVPIEIVFEAVILLPAALSKRDVVVAGYVLTGTIGTVGLKSAAYGNVVVAVDKVSRESAGCDVRIAGHQTTCAGAERRVEAAGRLNAGASTIGRVAKAAHPPGKSA
jgi:hypothetical protein